MIEGRAVPWSVEAVEVLHAAARYDTTAGLQSFAEVCAGSMLVEIARDGVPVLYYAARPIERAHGVELLIIAAAGRAPGVDLVTVGLEDVARRFPTVDAVTVQTRRAGLVRKLVNAGFAYQATKLSRRVRPCQ